MFKASCKILLLVVVTFAFMMTPDLVLATDPPPPMFGPGPSQTPVDGGLAFLAAGGVGYAMKKFRDRRRAKFD